MGSLDKVRNPYHDEKLLWPYHLKRSLEIIGGHIPAPSLIEIDPTDEGCNQRCIQCCFHSGPHRKLISIDVDMLMTFLTDSYEHGTYAYELVGGGEPTSHRNIADIVQRISSLKRPNLERPHIGMVTNGVLLSRVFPVAHLLDFVRVSLDAPEAHVYNIIHGVDASLGHFDIVLNNIKKLVEIIGRKKVRIGYIVMPPHNHYNEMMREIADLAWSIGVAHVAFRPAIVDYDVSPEVWRVVVRDIIEIKRQFEEGFILGGGGGSWDYATGERAQPTGVCRTRPLVLVIKADGTIPTCFLYREKLNERPAIGHISDGFSKVWFSEHHTRSLEAVSRLTCPEFCKLYRAEVALEEIEALSSSRSALPTLSDAELDNPHFI